MVSSLGLLTEPMRTIRQQDGLDAQVLYARRVPEVRSQAQSRLLGQVSAPTKFDSGSGCDMANFLSSSRPVVQSGADSQSWRFKSLSVSMRAWLLLNRTRFLGHQSDLNHHAARRLNAAAYASRGVMCPWRSMSHCSLYRRVNARTAAHSSSMSS